MVYIENMEMPSCCAKCKIEEKFGKDDPLFDEHDGFCNFVNQFTTATRFIGRMPNCPLVEVPPHGRLGDLDELKTAFPCGESIRTESVRATIDHMPTVIQTSKEG